MPVNLRDSIQEIQSDIVAFRHELHQHPEIRFEEEWTSGRIAGFLDDHGISYTRGYAKGTGIVAEIPGGQGSRGKTVALRADIDALEIHEETGLPYASQIPNRMHACGHDGHTACLCGAAAVLNKHRDSFSGIIRLIFQPAEEISAGGYYMVQEGVLDGVDAVFALHGWPWLPLGKVGVKEGCMMAGANEFYITIQGKGAHAANPGKGIDPVIVAAHIATALQTIVSRELDPWVEAVVSVTGITGGEATNVIPDQARLHGTFRALDVETSTTIGKAIERIAHATAEAFRTTAHTTFSDIPYPPLHNDASMARHVQATASRLFGEGALAPVERASMTAEDFAFFLQKIPGAYIWLGVNPSETKDYPSLHSPYYDFNDDAVPLGVELLAAAGLDFLLGPAKD